MPQNSLSLWLAAAIERLKVHREPETQRILTLQSTALPDATAESIELRAWEKGIVGTRHLRPLLDDCDNQLSTTSKNELRGLSSLPSPTSSNLASVAIADRRRRRETWRQSVFHSGLAGWMEAEMSHRRPLDFCLTGVSSESGDASPFTQPSPALPVKQNHPQASQEIDAM